MSFYYLASPYSKYPGGLDDAFHHACVAAGTLIRAGVNVFSPIAHFHPIAMLSGLDPTDAELWEEADAPFIDAADGIIVLMMPGWDQSDGIRHERTVFRASGKTEFMLPWPVTEDGVQGVTEALR